VSGASEFNYLAIAAPIFLLLIVLEWLLTWVTKKNVYNFGTALSDIACGSVYGVLEVFFDLFLLAVYGWVFDHLRIIDFAPGSPWPYVIGLVGVDFLFYWWHRESHLINWLWAVHGVHHQSEDYNLAVALRQPAFEPITWFFFYVWLAVLGVGPEVFLVSYAFNRIYQFFIHTQVIGKMGPVIEYVFNTPSHHRVHHGVQDQYLDKNYAGVLILWDRWFGTFEPEGEVVQYGTTVPLRSYDPVWANLQYWVHMARLSRQTSDAAAKWRVWWGHPAFVPAGVVPPAKAERDGTFEKYGPPLASAKRRYVAVQFVMMSAVMGVWLTWQHELSMVVLAFGAGVLLATFMGISALTENKPWGPLVERVRLWLFVPLTLVAVLTAVGPWAAAIATVLMAGYAAVANRWLTGALDRSAKITAN